MNPWINSVIRRIQIMRDLRAITILNKRIKNK